MTGENLAWWEERAALHGQDDVYDESALLAGASTLRAPELGLVGDPTGLNMIHIQCHIGHDSLSWLRAGASSVTGVDFSGSALEHAANLCATAGFGDRARFVQADSTALPPDLTGFDVAFASYGVLSWIGDLHAWMRCAAGALRPGGRLVLVELHPLAVMTTTFDPPAFDFPYCDAGPLRSEEAGSYARREADTHANVTIEHAHSLGEVVTAAIGAGLRLDALREFTSAAGHFTTLLPVDADGLCRWRVTGQELPLLYGLAATRL